VNFFVNFSQKEKVLKAAGTGYVGRPSSDVGLVAPILDEKLDRVSSLIAEVAFQLVLKFKFI
jgi:hypothetical protein